MRDDPFNLASLMIDAPPLATTPAKARRSKRGFVMVPLAWKNRLSAACNVCTLKVALELLFRHWKTGGKPILLANAAMGQLGVRRHSKWRALRELEALGLIKVERRPRKSPKVIVLDLPNDGDDETQAGIS